MDGGIGGHDVFHQSRLMELGTTVDECGDGRDAEAPSFIAEHIKKPRGIIDLIFGQVNIRGVIQGHEKKTDARHLHASGNDQSVGRDF